MRILFIFLFACLSTSICNAKEDWFETETPTGGVMVRHGWFEGGDTLRSIQVETSFLFKTELSAQYNQLTFSEQDEKQWLLQVETDPLADTSLLLRYADSERDNGYAFENISAQIRHSISNWDITAVYGRGDIDVSVTDIPPVLSSILSDLGVFSATQTQYGLGVHFFSDRWGWSLSYDYFDLDERVLISEIEINDLNAAQRVALLNLSRNLRDSGVQQGLNRSLYFAGASVNQQLNAGLDETLYFDGYHAFDAGWVLSAGIETFKVFYSDGRNTAIFSSLDIPLNTEFTFGVLIGADDNSKSSYSELSLHYYW